MFSNISPTSRVASILLSQFGKNTKVIIEVTGIRAYVRDAKTHTLIAQLIVSDTSAGEQVVTLWTTDSPLNRCYTMAEVESGWVSMLITAAPKFPQIGRNDRAWSIARYKDVDMAGAY